MSFDICGTDSLANDLFVCSHYINMLYSAFGATVRLDTDLDMNVGKGILNFKGSVPGPLQLWNGINVLSVLTAFPPHNVQCLLSLY